MLLFPRAVVGVVAARATSSAVGSARLLADIDAIGRGGGGGRAVVVVLIVPTRRSSGGVVGLNGRTCDRRGRRWHHHRVALLGLGVGVWFLKLIDALYFLL